MIFVYTLSSEYQHIWGDPGHRQNLKHQTWRRGYARGFAEGQPGFKSQLERPLTSPSLWFHTCKRWGSERPYLGGWLRRLGDVGHMERDPHSRVLLSKC